MNPEIMDQAAEPEQFQTDKSYGDLSQRDKRSLVFHLLYIMEVFDYEATMESIVDNLNRGFHMDVPLDAPEVETARLIIEQRAALDERYIPLLSNWRIERIGVCTKLILRYAIWELETGDTDPKIVINEAIELAKAFAEKDAFKFINGILDQIIKQKSEE
ncbi:MAG: transcription antitermination factor NusB [Candidatus Babeliales bacterium]